MRKRKMLFAGIAGLVLLGGAMGVGAKSNTGAKHPDNTGNVISMDEATTIALNESGGKLKEMKLEKEDGRLIYEIELFNDEKDRNVEIDIDAKTGNIIKIDQDDDDDRSGVAATSKEAKISLEEANAAAVTDTPGTVEDVELDAEDGYYKIEVDTGKNEVVMKVDSETGKIITKETD